MLSAITKGVIDEGTPSPPSGGSEQEVSGVAAEDPVVGPLGRLVPVAAPARVGHGVEEVVTGDPGRGAEGSRVDGLVAGEESGVAVAACSYSTSDSTSSSLRCGDTKGHCNESEEAHGDFHVECEVLLGECKDDDFLVGW